MENYSKTICELKHEFVKSYDGNSHTTEVLPNSTSAIIQINNEYLSLLHQIKLLKYLFP